MAEERILTPSTGPRTAPLQVLTVVEEPHPSQPLREWLDWMEGTDRVVMQTSSRHRKPADGVLNRRQVRDCIRAEAVDLVLIAESSWWQRVAALGWRARGIRVMRLEEAQRDVGIRDVAARELGLSRLARAAGRPGAGLQGGPGVSVVVTVLNEELTVGPLIDALLPQLRSDDEILVVDGGSKDGTWKELQRRAETDGRLRLLERPGTNISAGRNAGIAAAVHPVVACTDAGCDPAEDWLSSIRAPFGEPDPPGLVASVPEIVGSTALQVAQALACYPHPRDFQRPSWFVRAWGRLFGQVFRPELPYARSLAFTVSAWEKVGGFPERLPWVEDGVFGLSVAEEHECVCTRDARLRWSQRGSLRSTAAMYYRYGLGAADSGSTLLVLRDVARVGAYLGALACVGVAPRRTWPGLAGAAGAYYSLPLSRVLRERAGLAAAAWVPVAVLTKDVSKVAGAASGHWRRFRSARVG